MNRYYILYDQVRRYSIEITADKFDAMIEADVVDLTDRSSFNESEINNVMVLKTGTNV